MGSGTRPVQTQLLLFVNKLTTTTMAPCFFLILQVVGLASSLLKLIGLICLISDTLKKSMETKITTETIDHCFLHPPGSWAGLQPTATGWTVLAAS